MKRASLVAVSLLVTVACHGDNPPTEPTKTTTQILPVTSFSLSPVVQRIQPGDTVQLIATARFSDGSTQDVTSQAAWSSTQANVAKVSAGAVTGVGLGQTVIRGVFQRLGQSLTIVVEPDGTFIVRGRVTEPGDLGVSGATVDVTSGPSNQVTTDSSGFYALFGIAVNSTVRVRKTGYYDQTRLVTGDQQLNVMLSPSVPPVGVAGTYRATFTASPSCGLAAELKTRSYTARIDQDAARLTVTMSDAQFVNNPSLGLLNTFGGRVFGNSVIFDLGDGYYISYYGTPLEELLPDGRFIGIWGTMTAPVGQSLSGALAGGFTVKTGNKYTSCVANDNQMVLTRQ